MEWLIAAAAVVGMASVSFGQTVQDQLDDHEDRICALEELHGGPPCDPPPPPPPPSPPTSACVATPSGAAPPPASLVTTWDTIPYPAASPTHVSVASGPWSDPATWDAGVPGVNAVVRVAGSHAVLYDVDSTVELAAVGVEGVLCAQTDAPTQMVVGTIVVPPGGVLEWGTVAGPVTASAEIVIADRALATGGPDPDTGVSDPDQYLTGIIGLGAVTMAGDPRLPTFERLAAEPQVQDVSLSLAAAPSGWQVGDRIGLPDSRHLRRDNDGYQGATQQYAGEWEVRTITGISGSTVTLDTPLNFRHPSSYDPDGVTLFRHAHAANLGRSVTIRSENPNGTRGHVYLTDRADVEISHVRFADLGRTIEAALDPVTNHIGRYALHLHHLYGPVGHGAPVYRVDGIAIEETQATDMKWGGTIHDTHFGEWTNTVLFNAASGAALALEDGSESGNLIDGNFIAVVRSQIQAGQPNDNEAEDGRGGWALWSEGPLNTYTNNVFSGASFSAVYMNGNHTALTPSAPGEVPNVSVDLRTQAPDVFDANECYGSMGRCWDFWSIGDDRVDPNAEIPTITDSTIWHVHSAAVPFYLLRQLVIDGWEQRGDMAEIAADDDAFALQRAISASGAINDKVTLRNIDIRGMQTCIIQRSRTGFDFMVVEDALLQCREGVVVRPFTDTITGPSALNTLRRVSTLPVPGYSPRDIWAWWAPPDNNITLVPHQLFVEDWQGDPNDDFQVFWDVQDPALPLAWQNPSSVDPALHPDPSQTNQESWDAGNGATAGELATCSQTRAGIIDGYVCP